MRETERAAFAGRLFCLEGTQYCVLAKIAAFGIAGNVLGQQALLDAVRGEIAQLERL